MNALLQGTFKSDPILDIQGVIKIIRRKARVRVQTLKQNTKCISSSAISSQQISGINSAHK